MKLNVLFASGLLLLADQPAAASASARSFSVIPPALWVVRSITTVPLTVVTFPFSRFAPLLMPAP